MDHIGPRSERDHDERAAITEPPTDDPIVVVDGQAGQLLVTRGRKMFDHIPTGSIRSAVSEKVPERRLQRQIERMQILVLLKYQDQTALVLGVGIDQSGAHNERLPLMDQSAKREVVGQQRPS